MKKRYILKDIIYNCYVMDMCCDGWTPFVSCARKYDTLKDARSAAHRVAKIAHIKLKDIKIIESLSED